MLKKNLYSLVKVQFIIIFFILRDIAKNSHLIYSDFLFTDKDLFNTMRLVFDFSFKKFNFMYICFCKYS